MSKPTPMSNFISIQEASQMTALYRKEMNQILAEPFKGQSILSICETFDKKDLLSLINKPGCEKIRIYYGMDKSLSVHAILVAVNNKNEDILPSLEKSSSVEEQDILEHGDKCPVYCPPDSPLNT